MIEDGTDRPKVGHFASREGRTEAGRDQRRIEVPLVRAGRPGSVNLSGERIATMLDEEDAAPPTSTSG